MIEGLLIVLVGLFGGFAGGTLGVGGGVILVPVMTILFGLPQTIAQGTSLAAIIPSSAVSAIAYRREGSIDRRAVTAMAVVGAPGALVGAYFALQLPGDVLGRIFGLFLIVSAWLLWPGRKKKES